MDSNYSLSRKCDPVSDQSPCKRHIWLYLLSNFTMWRFTTCVLTTDWAKRQYCSWADGRLLLMRLNSQNASLGLFFFNGLQQKCPVLQMTVVSFQRDGFVWSDAVQTEPGFISLWACMSLCGWRALASAACFNKPLLRNGGFPSTASDWAGFSYSLLSTRADPIDIK